LTIQRKLEWFANEVSRRAAIIGAPVAYLPTYGHSDGSGQAHIVFDGILFSRVVEERGREFHRRSSSDPEEILYEVFQSVTFTMACDYEVCHRRAGEDSRRQLFEVQLRLLGQLADSWRERCRMQMDEILSRHPFDDVAALSAP
jgi:hypothetical protein